MDAAPVFGTQVFDRQRIRNTIGIESMSLISDDDEQKAPTKPVPLIKY